MPLFEAPPAAPVCFILCPHSLAFRLIYPFFFLMGKFLLPTSTLPEPGGALRFPPRGLSCTLSTLALFLGTVGSWRLAQRRHRRVVHSLSPCPRGKPKHLCSLQLVCCSQWKRGRVQTLSDHAPLFVLEGWLATCC